MIFNKQKRKILMAQIALGVGIGAGLAAVANTLVQDYNKAAACFIGSILLLFWVIGLVDDDN